MRGLGGYVYCVHVTTSQTHNNHVHAHACINPKTTPPRQLSEALTYESNPEKRRALLRQAEPQVQQLESLVCLFSVLVLVCVCLSEGQICWGWAG